MQRKLICNSTDAIRNGPYTPASDGSEWLDYTTGAPIAPEPLTNAGEWIDVATGQPVQVPVHNAGEWTPYVRPQLANESQTERFRGLSIAGLTRQLAEIAGGLHGEDLRRALPRLRDKLARLIEEIDATLAAGPVGNVDAGSEWVPYEKPIINRE